MSKIIAVNNLVSNEWQVTFEELKHDYAQLHIMFKGNAPVIDFVDLKFKYIIKHNSEIKQSGEFPIGDIQYIRSEGEYLETLFIPLVMETEYELYLWSENNGQICEKTISFTTPKPEQPFPSWSWDGESWIAPIPMPGDNRPYDWDEENKKWYFIEV
jgi:hypothetical protein